MKHLIIGFGGHGRVVLDALRVLGLSQIIVWERHQPEHLLPEIEFLISHDNHCPFPPEDIRMFNGIGGMYSSDSRRTVYERFVRDGYIFPSLAHPSAVIARDVRREAGSQVMANTTVQTGARIGADTIINTAATVDHDCVIGDHCLIAPGAILAGSVIVGNNAVIGPGAVVAQGVTIGSGALVAAGAVVIQDVSPGMRVQGVPAQEVRP